MMATEKQARICQVGAICAFVAGFCYVLMIICAFLSPVSIASYVTSEQYFIDFKGYRYIFIFLKFLMIVANSAFIGVVLAFQSLVRDKNYGLVLFVSALAFVGFSVGIFQSVVDLSRVPYLATQYEMGSENIKDVIIALGVANPFIYIISLGFPGLWLILVSVLALNNPMIPRLLAILGFMWGFGNILTVIAHVFVIMWLVYLVAFGGLLAAPFWSLWEGVFLWRISQKKQDVFNLS